MKFHRAAHVTVLAILLASASLAQSGTQGVEPDVLKVEEQFRKAKLENNAEALDRILADGYFGIAYKTGRI